MDIKASAGRTKQSFLSHCESLGLKATRESEPKLLAALFRVLYHGGTIRVEINGDASEFSACYPISPMKERA